MAKIALYQKYRSTTFEEVIGQDYIVRSIKNAVRTGRTGHAYLFCGPRGTGKTTMARLLAKAVNCDHPEKAPCNECENCIAANAGTHPDIVEINAANETHVDDIRDLIDRSTLAPMQGKYKVYIIDEVHQLSSAASSALLKTLEEPPENVIFILATTDPQKLLPTIISRCQRYDFTKVRTDLIENHLLDIAQKENIKMEKDAAHLIAVLADGGMRDSLSIMDQCASYTNDNITADDVNRIYGLTSTEEKINLMHDLVHKDIGSIISRIQNYEQQGIDLNRFTDGLIDILKDIVIYSSTKDSRLLKRLTEDTARKETEEIDSYSAMHIAEYLLDAKQKFKNSGNIGTAFEVICLSIATANDRASTIQNVVREEKRDTPSLTQSNPETKEIQPVQTESPTILNEDQVLSILVQCTKAEKQKDEPLLQNLIKNADLEEKKYTTLLSGTNIGASGQNCILFVTGQQAVANRINDPGTNKELYFFLKNNKIDKVPFAILNDFYRDCTKAFVKRRNNASLPDPMVIEKYENAEKKEDSSLTKAKELFGDKLEIIEGE